jgi:hypothetical protein
LYVRTDKFRLCNDLERADGARYGEKIGTIQEQESHPSKDACHAQDH